MLQKWSLSASLSNCCENSDRKLAVLRNQTRANMSRRHPAASRQVSIHVGGSQTSVNDSGAAKLLAHSGLQFRRLDAQPRTAAIVREVPFADHFTGRPTAGLWPVLAAAADDLGIDLSV